MSGKELDRKLPYDCEIFCAFCDKLKEFDLKIQFLDGTQEFTIIGVCEFHRNKLAQTPSRIRDEALV